MNKGYLLATAASAALAPLGAQAADLRPIKAPMVAVPAVHWAGWYVGLHAGAAWQQAHNSNYDWTPSTTATGFIGGGQIGHNWQNGNFVYGWEVDGSGLSGKGTGIQTICCPATYSVENKIDWLVTARGRMGLAVGNTMAYATAGLAVGGVKNAFIFNPNSQYGIKSESKTRVGFAVGGGIEHLLNRNWTVGLEGMFVDLGRSTVNNNFGSSFNYATKFSNQAVIARMKLNYKW